MSRDYTIVIDKSGSMGTQLPSGQTRWDAAKESTLAFTRKVTALDPDGITVYAFNGKFKRYGNQTADIVEKIFSEDEPMGSTNLAGVLQDVFEHWAHTKKPETVIVVTDGAPDDKEAAVRAIVNVTKEMDADEQLCVLFLQIGNDSGARDFLQFLDDGLVEKRGAKFDIVDTKTFDEIEASGLTITQILEQAIVD